MTSLEYRAQRNAYLLSYSYACVDLIPQNRILFALEELLAQTSLWKVEPWSSRAAGKLD